MKKMTLERIKHTKKLESLIAQGADYELILKQSQKIDKYIVEEMKERNKRKNFNKF